MRLSLGLTLAESKVRALLAIDEAAEAARLRFLTGGAGQALEYQASEAQARAFIAVIDTGATPNLALYPFVAAEAAAIADATGAAPDAYQVAVDIVTLADTWGQVGAYIKQLRRAAKLRVEAATTPAEVRAAAAVNWPTPA